MSPNVILPPGKFPGKLAYIGPFGWRPKVVYSTLPNIVYTRKEVVFGDPLSISFNMGLLLIDNNGEQDKSS